MPSVTASGSPASTVDGVARSRTVTAGVTAFEAADAGPEPTALVA